MSELDDLVAACVAAPHDDAPRLVWADAVGGERGEFVVLQCRLAREELSPAEQGALIRRHDELLAAHGRAWSGFNDEGGARRYVFRRGFVEAVELDLYKIAWSTLFKRMPLVQSVHLCGATRSIAYHESGEPEGPEPIPFLAHLFEQPELQRLRGFEIDSVYLHESDGDTEWDFHITRYGDEALDVVKQSGKLAGFRTFAIREEFTPRGFQALLDSNALTSVENLALDWGKIDREQVIELFARMPNLRALETRSALSLEDVAGLIPTSVVELRVGSASVDDVAALAASPVAASLERLQLWTSGVPTMTFDRFPRVRALDFGFSSGSKEHRADIIAAFTRSRLPALRELRAFHELTDEQAIAIADAFGPQLACLDVLGQDLTSADVLRAKVAGHVRTGGYAKAESPMVVGIDTREPWIRYGLVEGEW